MDVLMLPHSGSSFRTVCRYFDVLAASSLISTSFPSFDRIFTVLLMMDSVLRRLLVIGF